MTSARQSERKKAGTELPFAIIEDSEAVVASTRRDERDERVANTVPFYVVGNDISHELPFDIDMQPITGMEVSQSIKIREEVQSTDVVGLQYDDTLVSTAEQNNLRQVIDNNKAMTSKTEGVFPRFYVNAAGEIMVQKKDGKTEVLASYHIKFLSLTRKISSVGPAQNTIQLMLIKNDMQDELSLPAQKFDALARFATELSPDYYLGFSRQAESLFREYTHTLYAASKNEMELKVEYDIIGWYQDADIGWRYISHRLANCISKNSRQLVHVGPENMISVCNWGFEVLNIASNERVGWVLLLYLLYGFSIPMLREAGLTPQMVLMLRGRSGSLKTAVSKVLYNLFDIKEAINFQSTKVALEDNIAQAWDNNILIDDIYNAADRRMKQIFHELLRCIADNIGRSKYDVQSGNTVQFNYRVGCVVTAEKAMNDQQSTRLRYLVLGITGHTFDGKKLKKYQENAEFQKAQHQANGLEQYISLYVAFLESNWHSVVQRIKEVVSGIEMPCKERRLNSAYLCLHALTCTAFDFADWCGYGKKLRASYSMQQVDIILKKWLQENEYEAVVVEDYRVWLEIINEGLSSGRLAIAANSTEYRASKGKVYGYSDTAKKAYILQPDDTFQYVLEQAKKVYSDTLTLSRASIEEKLDEMGVLQGSDETSHGHTRRRHRKRILISGRQVWMLQMDITMFDKVIQDINDTTEG